MYSDVNNKQRKLILLTNRELEIFYNNMKTVIFVKRVKVFKIILIAYRSQKIKCFHLILINRSLKNYLPVVGTSCRTKSSICDAKSKCIKYNAWLNTLVKNIRED